MKRKNGFTLTELLLVISIVAIMAIMLVGILNPIFLVNKAKDSERKKDLDAIKKSFEEYFNDKGRYPTNVNDWNIKSNCEKNVTDFKYLNPWPCDPVSGEPYDIIVGNNGRWFKVLTNLGNRKDSDIPVGWYNTSPSYFYDVDINKVNYGVSSSNIKWYEKTVDPICQQSWDNHDCYKWLNGSCNSSTDNSCGAGYDCFLSNDCTVCPVECCGIGCEVLKLK